ncbi:MAG TPA: DUF1573 domain-containing protein [Candidatus Paceibacterota bacterium]|nr:DUF1573 domain-containing protein [Candidatus Paceibacterota bacterium]
MLRSHRDIAEVILGVLIFCAVFVIAEKSGLREKITGNEALLTRGVEGAHLYARESFYDFGRISMRDGEKKISFEIHNNGKEDVSIKKIYTTCQCLEVSLIRGSEKIGPFSVRDYLYPGNGQMIIKKGEKVTAEVVYTPSLQGPFGVGLSEPFAVIEDGRGEKIDLRISALVFP